MYVRIWMCVCMYVSMYVATVAVVRIYARIHVCSD